MIVICNDDFKPQLVELGGMVEGVACRYEFLIRNNTDYEIRDLSTRVSCGCLRATELEGKTLASKGELAFKATVLPTSNTFSQKLSLGGVTGDGARKEIAVAHFTGKVAAPMDINPKSITTSELNSGSVRVKIGAQKGVSFDLKKAVLLDDRFKMEACDGDELIISTHLRNVVAQILLIQIPFRVQQTEFQHTIRLEVVNSSLNVSPATIVLSELNGTYAGRFIVQSKIDAILENIEVEVEELGVKSAVSIPAEFSQRRTQHLKIFQFKLPTTSREGEIPNFRIIVRANVGDSSHEKVIECLVP